MEQPLSEKSGMVYWGMFASLSPGESRPFSWDRCSVAAVFCIFPSVKRHGRAANIFLNIFWLKPPNLITLCKAIALSRTNIFIHSNLDIAKSTSYNFQRLIPRLLPIAMIIYFVLFYFGRGSFELYQIHHVHFKRSEPNLIPKKVPLLFYRGVHIGYLRDVILHFRRLVLH